MNTHATEVAAAVLCLLPMTASAPALAADSDGLPSSRASTIGSALDAHTRGWDAAQRNDYAGALRWYHVAAGAGLAKSQHNIGTHYVAGLGVRKDEAEAARWFRMAADQGFGPSQFSLAVLYEEGRGGLPVDLRQARLWYLRAAANGDAQAKRILSEEKFQLLGEVAPGQAPKLPVAPNPATGDPQSQSAPVKAVARGLGVVPGAIVCDNFRLVEVMFSAYSESVMLMLQDQMTGGQTRLLRGEPKLPDLRAYGCTLLLPGTSLEVSTGGIVPVIAATDSDGRAVRGVTLHGMIER